MNDVFFPAFLSSQSTSRTLKNPKSKRVCIPKVVIDYAMYDNPPRRRRTFS